MAEVVVVAKPEGEKGRKDAGLAAQRPARLGSQSNALWFIGLDPQPQNRVIAPKGRTFRLPFTMKPSKSHINGMFDLIRLNHGKAGVEGAATLRARLEQKRAKGGDRGSPV